MKPTRALFSLSVAVAVLGGCSGTESTAASTPTDRGRAESSGAGRDTGRPTLDAGAPLVDDSTADATTDTGGDNDDAPGEMPVTTDLSLLALSVPASGNTPHSASVDGSVVLARPVDSCDGRTEAPVAVQGFSVVNDTGEPVTVSVYVRTGADSPSLTLPSADLFLYPAGTLPARPGACVRAGLAATPPAAIESIAMASGEVLELLLASSAADATGSYQLLLVRDDNIPTTVPGSTSGGDGGSGGDAGSLCTNTCEYAGDTDCDDGGPGADYDVCAYGTDCADCGPRDAGTAPRCSDLCPYAFDFECDDGGPGATTDFCEFGTDCFDCGIR
ncbi:MAG: hypothetical protein H6700_07815 [Myxococcales bacterium]|nr:hypothetical protein [Myxococcales bacterium]MCB9521016.1 hypothetical protein [Myxococcales bacterium]MCB9531657.1 hypothetical protein [Myxococcales bacterium]